MEDRTKMIASLGEARHSSDRCDSLGHRKGMKWRAELSTVKKAEGVSTGTNLTPQPPPHNRDLHDT